MLDINSAAENGLFSLFRRTILIAGALLLILATASGAAAELPTAGAQAAASTGPEIGRELSVLNIGFEAAPDEIAAVLNQMIGAELYKGATTTSGLSIQILRSGPLSISAAENYVFLTVPASITLRYNRFSLAPFSTNLRFRVGARVAPDWRVQADVSYLGLSDLFREQVGIGPISIRPRTVVEGITQPLQKVVSELITRSLNEKYPLKSHVTKAWDALRKPVLLDRKYRSWLRIAPQGIVVYPVVASANRVSMSIGLKSFADVVVGPEPAAPAMSALPALTLANGSEKHFRIALHTDLYYRDLTDVARPLFVDQEFGQDGKKLVVREIDISGEGNRLVVMLRTEGALDGRVYLSCRPSFNPETKVFSVEDVDFDLRTGNFLMKSAAWLLHSAIAGRISEVITATLTEKLQQARETGGKALSDVKIAEHIVLMGKLDGLQLREVAVQKEKLSIRVLAVGETLLKFQ